MDGAVDRVLLVHSVNQLIANGVHGGLTDLKCP